MLQSLINAFRVGDLRRKLVYTALLLAVFRIGCYIPVPGVNAAKLVDQFGEGGLFSLLDMFAGGALKNFTVFAMGVNPYITSSIIIQLLTVVVPALEQLAKEGIEGRKKIAQYTRYGTLVLGIIQALGITMAIKGAVEVPGVLAIVLIVTTLTAGTCFLMWLGEKITEHGIGNGISLIIFTGIVARYPANIHVTALTIGQGGINPLNVVLFLLLAVASVIGVIWIQEGQRRIPVQYAKRVVGRRMYGGQSTHLPLRVNQAGVMPVIFASSVLAFPMTIAQFVPKLEFLRTWQQDHVLYMTIYAILVVLFTYFYTAVTFNVNEVASNMKKYGGFVPGIRPGKPTADYLERVLSRITLVGAIFLAAIALLPTFMSSITKVSSIYFGGTALLIVVGVALDTMKQIEAQLLMRQYEGFIK
ncbi:MAG TPA: preprotein translocase subunit SecY [Firmicutes bacterium]|nr:preprotein translocase subunit SecY [Bacillota bacterium]HHY98458.1 preprotein translocase subunit SecY [Bacillota bacterium]